MIHWRARCFVWALVGILAASFAFAQETEVKRILQTFDTIRPTPRELSIFRLDWVPTLKEGRQRAAREGRPIFLLAVENEHGGLFGGHC